VGFSLVAVVGDVDDRDAPTARRVQARRQQLEKDPPGERAKERMVAIGVQPVSGEPEDRPTNTEGSRPTRPATTIVSKPPKTKKSPTSRSASDPKIHAAAVMSTTNAITPNALDFTKASLLIEFDTGTFCIGS
jgi:hypothetical protein